MIIDVLLAVGAALLSSLLDAFPSPVQVPLPVSALDWLAPYLQMINQVLPLDTLAQVAAIILALRLSVMIWEVMLLCWRLLPFVGH